MTMKNFFCLFSLLLSLLFWWPAGATGQVISALPNTNSIKGSDLLYIVVTNTGLATNVSRNMTFSQFMANLITQGFRTNTTIITNINPTQFQVGPLGLTITNGARLTNGYMEAGFTVNGGQTNLTLLSSQFLTTTADGLFTNGIFNATQFSLDASRTLNIVSGVPLTNTVFWTTATMEGAGNLIFATGQDNWDLQADFPNILKFNNGGSNIFNLTPRYLEPLTPFSLGQPTSQLSDVFITNLSTSGFITNAALSNRLVWADSLGVLRPVTNLSGLTFTNGTLSNTVAAGNFTWPPTNSGALIQKHTFVYTNKVATVSVIPTDNTIPQISEGVGAMTNSFTPASTNSLLLVEVVANFSASTTLNVCGAIFDAVNTNAFGAAFVRIDGADVVYQCVIPGTLTNTSLTPRSFVFNWGPNGATTAYINRGNTAGFTNLFGDVLNTVMTIEEIQR